MTNISPLAVFVQSFIPHCIVLGNAFFVILDEFFFFFFGKLNTRFWPCLKLVFDLCSLFLLLLLLFLSFSSFVFIVIDLFVFIYRGRLWQRMLKIESCSITSLVLGSFNPCFQLRLIPTPSLFSVFE